MASVSKNVYIDKSGDIVNKYNNTYHSTIKIKSIDGRSNRYIDSSKTIDHKDPKFTVVDNVRIWKYKVIYEKAYFTNWSEEVFMIKKSERYCAVDICC